MVVEVTFLGMRNPILGRSYIYINMDICEKKFWKSLVVVHIITYLCNREKNHAHEYKDHDKDVSRVFQDPTRLEGMVVWLLCTWGRNVQELRRPVDLVTDGTLLPFAVESANRDKILIYERAS